MRALVSRNKVHFSKLTVHSFPYSVLPYPFLKKFSVFLFSPRIYLAVTLVYTFLFTSNTFKSNARPKLAKNQAIANRHPEAELLLFENYSLSLSTLSSKNDKDVLNNVQKQ